MDVGSGDFVTHERIARWAEAPERLETPEEGAARLALASLKAALMPSTTQAHCVQAALCRGNKESRELQGHSKYWLPVWRYIKKELLINYFLQILTCKGCYNNVRNNF